MFKKIILGIFSLLLIAFVGIWFYAHDTPSLPEGTEAAIAEALKEEIPEFVNGKVGYADNDGVKIWYEAISETDSIKGTVLLVMGYTAHALIWGEYFYQPLLDAGYQVIRYDNRGVGMSDWMEDWTEENAYDLSDMAKDGIAILDDLGIQQAHVAGVSMGGMICQTMAINHPERVKSLTSIMSSGYYFDPEMKNDAEYLQTLLFKNVLKYLIFPSDENACKFSVAVDQGLAGTDGYTMDTKYIAHRTMYDNKKRRGANPKAGDQHGLAIQKSGSRYDSLAKINMPTLVVHGKADPLIHVSHTEKYAPMIPNAETLYLDGMGHSLPPKYVPAITNAMLKTFEKASVIKEQLFDDK